MHAIAPGTSTPVFFLVALPAEAKPLIRAFGLVRRQPDAVCPCYVNGPLTLALSGPGGAAAGAAAAALGSRPDAHRHHWINLGIAGHARLTPGSCLLADSVTDTQSGTRWALNPVPDLPATNLGPLRCVQAAERTFPVAAGYDMESAAIARTLSDTGALARLHIMKIVSDNPGHPSHRINARMVSELIERQLPTLNALIDRLQSHAPTR